jgi:hypothetical protein
MKNLRFLKYIGFGILGLAFVALFVFLTMSLWNWLVPALFHGPVLTYWQTAGLFILSKILLTGVAPGGHRHGRGYRHDWRYKYGEKHGYCRPAESTDSVEQKV